MACFSCERGPHGGLLIQIGTVAEATALVRARLQMRIIE
jgi:hypothetical protein